ncbi:MAG: sensor histidine kinase [Ignavibacteriales bacterium]|nr:sensor histidine kinase [Ignavibacteriales bacterium]
MSLNDLIKSLFDPANPIYLSIIIVVAFFSLIFFVYKYLINPSISKYKIEKENIELQSAKLMALFAQLDPDPLIRIDSTGTIIETNKAAQKVLSTFELKGKKVNDVLPFVNFVPGSNLNENQSNLLTYTIDNRIFSVLYRSEPSLDITHIYFHDITDIKTYQEKLIESQNKLRDLSDHLQNLIEKERQRIASGLHDGIGQSLSMLRIKLLRLSEKDTSPAQRMNYQSIVDTLEDTILELKTISYDLKPKMLEEMGLGFALKYLVDRVVTETGLVAEVNVVGGEYRLESKLEIYLYRIVQESITNILKYSKATNFSIQLVISMQSLRLIISDNGKGFDVEEVNSRKNTLHGLGLINMRERVESYQGQLKIESSPESGTLIVIEIPMRNDLIWQNQNQYAL